MKTPISMLVLCLSLLVGCTGDLGGTQPDTLDATEGIEYSLDGMMTIGTIPGEDEDPSVGGDALVAASRVSRSVDSLMKADAPLAEVDAEAREVILSAPGLSEAGRWALVADLGGRMLRVHLSAERPDPEAVAFYAQRLVDQGSPNAEDLARAFDYLEASGAWSGERLAAARLQAADAVVAQYSRRSSKRPGVSPPAEMRAQREAQEGAAREMRRKARASSGE